MLGRNRKAGMGMAVATVPRGTVQCNEDSDVGTILFPSHHSALVQALSGSKEQEEQR